MSAAVQTTGNPPGWDAISASYYTSLRSVWRPPPIPKPFPRTDIDRSRIWERRMFRMTQKRWERRRQRLGEVAWYLGVAWGTVGALAVTIAILNALVRLTLG